MNWFTAVDPATPYSEQDFTGQWVTAGPYYIAAHDIGRSVVLQRNKNYTGKRPAQRRPDRGHGRRRREPEPPAGQGRPGRPRLGSPRCCRRRARRRSTASTRRSSGSSRRRSPRPGGRSTRCRERRSPTSSSARRSTGRSTDRPGPHLRQVRRSTHRPDPAAGDARLRLEQQPLRRTRARTSPRRRRSRATSPTSRRSASSPGTRRSNINRGQLMRYELEQIGLKAKTESVPFAAADGSRREPQDRRLRHGERRMAGRLPGSVRTSSTSCSTGPRSRRATGSSNNWSFFNSAEVQHSDEKGRTAER